MKGEKDFQNGARCVYYTGSKYKRMSHTYKAKFSIPANVFFPYAVSASPPISVNVPLTSVTPFNIEALTAGDPTPTSISSQFLLAASSATYMNIGGIPGSPNVDVYDILTATTFVSAVGNYTDPQFSVVGNNLVVSYTDYATISSTVGGVNGYLTIGADIFLFITTTSLLPNAPRVSKASPTTIRYKKVVCWGLSPQAINFAQATTLGHRVAISLPVDLMNKYFQWTRASQEASPTGRFVSNPAGIGAGNDFVSQLVKAFGQEFNDMDGVANGLNFSSSALDVAGDLKRDPCVYNAQTDIGLAAGGSATGTSSTHYGANDLVMAYLMFKCFGSSSYDPTEIIYNVDDAYNMLTSQQLADVINASLEAEDALANAAVQPNGKAPSLQLAGDNKGQVDAMFRGFLASDPLRYFLNGVQIPGLFETNFTCPPSDPSVGGNWCLTAGDKLEIPLQLVFRAPVTVMSVQDNIQNPSSATPDSSTTEIIKGESATFDCSAQKAALGNVVSIRLQITCAKPNGADTGSTSVPAGSAVPLTVATSSVIFYSPENYGVQTASVIAVAGGTPTSGVVAYTYSVDTANTHMSFPLGSSPGNVSIDANGKLSFRPSNVYRGPWGKWTLPIDVSDGTNTKKVWVNVSIDDGNGASNTSIYLNAQTKNAGYNTSIVTSAPGVTPMVVKTNPLYTQPSVMLELGRTIIYASPTFAVDAATSSAAPTLPTDAILSKPLSYDLMTFTYTPPAVNSISGVAPDKLAKKVTWSITSTGGKSGAQATPNGMIFSSGDVTLSVDGAPSAAYLEINLDPSSTPAIPTEFTNTDTAPAWTTALAGADYSPGNAAGNVAGRYEFIVTATDDNNFSQSFPVSINIATPSPKSAKTPLVVTGTAGLSYVNGNTLTYARTTGGIDETLTLTNDQGGSNFKWDLVPVGTALVRPTDISISSVANVATVTLSTAYINPGIYPYLITALDNKNVVQTIFFTLNIV